VPKEGKVERSERGAHGEPDSAKMQAAGTRQLKAHQNLTATNKKKKILKSGQKIVMTAANDTSKKSRQRGTDVGNYESSSL